MTPVAVLFLVSFLSCICPARNFNAAIGNAVELTRQKSCRLKSCSGITKGVIAPKDRRKRKSANGVFLNIQLVAAEVRTGLL